MERFPQKKMFQCIRKWISAFRPLFAQDVADLYQRQIDSDPKSNDGVVICTSKLP